MSEPTFTAIRTTGGLIPPDLLTRLTDDRHRLDGLASGDYHLPGGVSPRQAASGAWERLAASWPIRDPEQPPTPTAAARWTTALLDELGFIDPTPALPGGITVGERAFPISHTWGEHVVLHQVGWGTDLDRRIPTATTSNPAPQATVQEFLNRSESHLWAVLTNGQRLRLLRDSTTLVGSAHCEFDLQAIIDGELFSDFLALFLVGHASRFQPRAPERGPGDCWLEQWRSQAATQGLRALEQLRQGVSAAITTLGTGFLQHPDNTQLRKHLATGALGIDDYLRTLLRATYRLVFWFVAEDRDILHPTDPGIDGEVARRRYAAFYSAAHLRKVAYRRHGTRQTDLWQTVTLVFDALGRDHGRPELALPGIGGIFDHGPLDEPLDGATLSNEALLKAVRELTIIRDEAGGRRRTVDFRRLGAEELGSVYESLLELHPRHNPTSQTFTLDAIAGNERKTTGSFYTPTSLVDALLDSTLNPLLDRACASDDPQTALLTITVCDPACGSGHFLVAAARRIAKRLASARTGDNEPTPDAVRAALHPVVGSCIHGVDVNPMAVEIAKISLWLETLNRGTPLSYLDANLRVGNALLGATPALLAGGLPDDAFKPLLGDDMKIAGAVTRRNRAERTVAAGQGELIDTHALRATHQCLAHAARDLRRREAAGQGTRLTLADIHVQAKRHRDLERSTDLAHARRLADAWCAAFVWPTTPDGPAPVTNRTLATLGADPGSLPADTAGELDRITSAYRFFHWHLEFPQIFTIPAAGDPDLDPATGWAGGFTCVLGNVPWERIKLQEQEFFAAKDPEVTKAPNAAARKRLIQRLETDDPTLHAAYVAAKRRAEGESHLLHLAGRHPLTGRGDINTYAVFAETGRTILEPRGRFGIITPTGIAADATTQHFFRDLVESASLASLYDFENAQPLFEGVHRSFKFCLLTIAGRGVRERTADFAFFLHDPSELKHPDTTFTLTPEEIRILNPNTGTCPVFRTRRDAEVTLGIYRRVPVLIRDGNPDGNPWGLSFKTMFHMSNDSGLFHTRDQLETDGWSLHGNTFTSGTERMLPLYEAKMLHHYDHRWATYEPDGSVRNVTLAEKQDPNFVVMPRYWVAAEEVDRKLAGHPNRGWLLGFRKICRATDERTVVTLVFPLAGIGDSGNLLLSVAPRPWLLGSCATSMTLDYVLRQKLGGTNLNYFQFKQMAVLSGAVYGRVAPWDSARTTEQWVELRIHELVYTAWSMKPLAEDMSLDGSPFRWDEERRAVLRAELDAAYFHLYGVSRDDADYILGTFPIVRRKEEQEIGEYRTRRLVLAAYDSMAAAIASGQPYQSPLDPPPGQGPRHPERGTHRTAVLAARAEVETLASAPVIAGAPAHEVSTRPSVRAARKVSSRR